MKSLVRNPIEPYFNYLSDQLSIPREKQESLISIIEPLRRIVEDFVPGLVDVLPFGSLTRGTCLPTINDHKMDFDTMIVMSGKEIMSGSLLEKRDTYSDRQKAFLQNCVEDGTFYLYNAIDAFCASMNNGSPFTFVNDSPSAVLEVGDGKVEVSFAMDYAHDERGKRFMMYFNKSHTEGRYPDLESRYHGPAIVSGSSDDGNERPVITHATPFYFNDIQEWANKNFKIKSQISFRLVKYIARSNKIPLPTWFLEHDFYTALSNSSNIPENSTVFSLALAFFEDDRWHNRELYEKYDEFLLMMEKVSNFRSALKGESPESAIAYLLDVAPPPFSSREDVFNGLLDWMKEDRA